MNEHSYPGDEPHLRVESWSNPVYVVLTRLRRSIGDLLERAGFEGGRVLDLGAADAPYRDLFPPNTTYEMADLPGNPRAAFDVREDGSVDAPSGAFDLVLSTQVLEHVTDPVVYLTECYRTLRPGGHLILSTHGLMRYHPVPTDFWRWTHPGLRRQLTLAGLEVVYSEGLLSRLTVALHLLQDATQHRIPRWCRRFYIGFFQRLIDAIDRRQRDEVRSVDAMVFVCLARKPLSDPESETLTGE